MSTTYRADVDAVAQAYLRDRVNVHLNPYHNGSYPARTNTAHLDYFSATPLEAVPSAAYLGPTVVGSTIRQAVINLANYYARITRARYGLATNAGLVETGYAYFVLKPSAPNMSYKQSVLGTDINAITTPAGSIKYSDVVARYDHCWAAVYNHRDDITVDLTVCHSSCHSSCHGSRGRR